MYIHINLNGYQPVLSVIFPLNINPWHVPDTWRSARRCTTSYRSRWWAALVVVVPGNGCFVVAVISNQTAKRGGPGLDICILTIYIAI